MTRQTRIRRRLRDAAPGAGPAREDVPPARRRPHSTALPRPTRRHVDPPPAPSAAAWDGPVWSNYGGWVA